MHWDSAPSIDLCEMDDELLADMAYMVDCDQRVLNINLADMDDIKTSSCPNCLSDYDHMDVNFSSLFDEHFLALYQSVMLSGIPDILGHICPICSKL
ncbi:unnamed protein product [Didymodactylos carnosus]|uniref:Uncharacterized protein n=1 Tax=Didymodactylos carnosus TaxID=1234261 RepID=A0A8S2FCE3_9BILA|nr:unnamed protein product [Didymodactylos carnosus]CAF4223035.1 unnamed protein product [Didymodactylos carnosus]